MNDNGIDRSSEAQEANLIEDDQQRAVVEVENGFRQFDFAMQELDDWKNNKNYRLKPSLLLKLNRIALESVHPQPGVFRAGDIDISGSGHKPPPPEKVPELIEKFCDYINENWERKTPLHLSSYAMWKLNWIHPFADGNGRTSRIMSYLILCAKVGNRIPGVKSIPEQIAENKQPYYVALEAADDAWSKDIIDLSAMENLLESYLANQLVDIHKNAVGKISSEISKKVGSKKETSKIAYIEKHPVIFTFVSGLILLILGSLFA